MPKQAVRLVLVAGLVVAVGLAASLAGNLAPAQEAPAQKPNIVLVITDDMREDDFEHMPKTKALIADQGITFDNAFVTTPLCCPARTSIFSGQYAHNHQVLSNREADGGGYEKYRARGYEDDNLATWLDGAGYRTGLFGKYVNGYGREEAAHVPPGWDEWNAHLGLKAYHDYYLSENGREVHYGTSPDAYATDVLARKATGFIRDAAGSPEPLFAYVAPTAPHVPYVNAPRHDGLFAGAKAPRGPAFDEADVSDKPAWIRNSPRLSADEEAKLDAKQGKRLRMLQAVDELVEGIADELEATGRLENTYLVFTSDNGYLLGEHRVVETKRAAYEESISVPLVARGPGIPAGRKTSKIALNNDVAPTFAELAGAPVPSYVDGRSLAPLFAADPASWRTALLEGNYDNDKLVPKHRSVRTEGGQKFIETTSSGVKEFYDLASDPHELESDPADPRAAALASRLEALKTCSGESCRAAEDAP